MTIIKDISGPPRDYKKVEQEEKLKHIENAKTEKEDGVKKKKPVFSGKDKVEISSEGQALAANKTQVDTYMDGLLKSRISSIEDIKVIHGKIESNYYFRPEVLETIVESLISEDQFKSISTEGARFEKKLTDEQINHIQKKIKNGDYNASNVLDGVISKLMKII